MSGGTVPGLEPGLHYGVPEADYHADPALSRSRVSVMATSTPAHYKAYAPRSSRAFDVGTAAHLYLLEPSEFVVRVSMADQCYGETRSGDRCKKMGATVGEKGLQFCGLHASDEDQAHHDEIGCVILSADDYGTVLGMNEVLRAHPLVQRIMENRSGVEVTGVWDEPEGRCRFRVDVVSEVLGERFLFDYKTTRKRLTREFVVSRVLADLNYHHQAGWYEKGWRELTGEERTFGFIMQEKVKPFAVRVVRVQPADVRAGWLQMQDALRAIRQCEDTDEWPGYPARFMDVMLPEYVLGQDFTEEED